MGLSSGIKKTHKQTCKQQLGLAEKIMETVMIEKKKEMNTWLRAGEKPLFRFTAYHLNVRSETCNFVFECSEYKPTIFFTVSNVDILMMSFNFSTEVNRIKHTLKVIKFLL